MRRAIFIAMALIVVFLLATHGCSSGQSVKDPGDDMKMLSGNWVVKQIRGMDVGSMLGPGSHAPTMAISEDSKVSGFAGVNRYTSSLDIDQLAHHGFKLDGIASTRMAGEPAAMDLESKYLGALHEVTGFKLDGGTLSLTRGLETLLKFSRGG